MSYIEPNELIFYNDSENGIHSGGFSVNSLFMKAGMSPIVTLNQTSNDNIQNKIGGSGSEQVSDLFNDLVVPNWALFTPNMDGGGSRRNMKEELNDSDDDVIDDDLHEKLLELVKPDDSEIKKNNRQNANIKSGKKMSKKINYKLKLKKTKKNRK